MAKENNFFAASFPSLYVNVTLDAGHKKAEYLVYPFFILDIRQIQDIKRQISGLSHPFNRQGWCILG